MSKIQYKKSESGIYEFTINDPHPPEIDAFKRGPLKFYVSEPVNGLNPDTVPILALHGHGELGNTNYLQSLHRSLTTKKNALVITVDYIGLKTMRQKLATIRFDEWCFIQTNNYLTTRGLPPVPAELLKTTNPLESMLTFFQGFPDYIKSKDDPLFFILKRFDDDHYDFGLIQALDCLWAIKIIKERYPTINWGQLVAGGVSHGGYLATQCARLAPNTFSLIINAYGWTKPYLNWIFKERLYWHRRREGIPLGFFRDDYWSADPHSPYFFSPDRNLIRTLDDEDQLSQWKAQMKEGTQLFLFTHQVNDEMHPRVDKDKLIESMRRLKFNLEYYVGNSDAGIQYRSLDKVSFKGLFYDFATEDRLNKHPVEVCDYERKSVIVYLCGKTKYEIDFSGDFPRLKTSSI